MASNTTRRRRRAASPSGSRSNATGDCGSPTRNEASARFKSRGALPNQARAAASMPYARRPNQARASHSSSTEARPYQKVRRTPVQASRALEAQELPADPRRMRATCMASVDAPLVMRPASRLSHAARPTAMKSTPGCHGNRRSSVATTAPSTFAGTSASRTGRPMPRGRYSYRSRPSRSVTWTADGTSAGSNRRGGQNATTPARIARTSARRLTRPHPPQAG